MNLGKPSYVVHILQGSRAKDQAPAILALPDPTHAHDHQIYVHSLWTVMIFLRSTTRL